MRYTSSPVRTVAPAADVVTLAEAKAHLRVEHGEEDTLITTYLQAAINRLDGFAGILGRCLITQSWRVDTYDVPPDDTIRLLFPDVSAVSIAYVDPDGATQTLDAAVYHLVHDAMGGRVDLAHGASWPATAIRPDAVRVTVTAGYGATAAAVPHPIKAAILLMVADLYRNRETVTIGVSSAAIPMSMTVDALIAPYRRVGI
jgi:uncharacterized phiE125 gp8 family phage protein